MKLVICGLTISSSWGNGHATLWRGWCKALLNQGHDVVFFERDVPYYAEHRDYVEMPGGELVLYTNWPSVLQQVRRHLSDADAGMVTSYCPDAIEATEALLESRAGVKCFYDLDTPVTLHRLWSGEPVPYIGPRGLRDFDVVLSYTGGQALAALKESLGARRTVPIYGSVDPDIHKPVPASPGYRTDLSYLGTYAEDRQESLRRLFIEPARQRPDRRFVIGGAQYPSHFPWTDNIFFTRHLPPSEHPAFFCSSRLTLNITRAAMAAMGFCPSGRLFEAAACGAPILSDAWEGLEQFFEPDSEILIARDTADTLAAIDLPDERLRTLATAARARVLTEHTAEKRAQEMVEALESGAETHADNTLAETTREV